MIFQSRYHWYHQIRFYFFPGYFLPERSTPPWISPLFIFAVMSFATAFSSAVAFPDLRFVCVIFIMACKIKLKLNKMTQTSDKQLSPAPTQTERRTQAVVRFFPNVLHGNPSCCLREARRNGLSTTPRVHVLHGSASTAGTAGAGSVGRDVVRF